MPRKKLTHSRADIKAQIVLLESIGKKVVQVKYHDDGSFRLVTADALKQAAEAAQQANPWDAEFAQ